mgnify:CR=1 FL=1
MQATEIHEEVRKRYGQVAVTRSGCCGTSCCGGDDTAAVLSTKLGYSEEDVTTVPDGANLGLGCGNPVALAAMQPGETVLDLGSGAGFDCFLAARKVGPEGRVIGVDMTPEMLARARKNAETGGYANVEFREGTIEALPVEDASVDVVISNCVINLSPDKDQVFREIHRVLKPGGRVYVSDLVLKRRLPWFLRRSMALYAACVAGALQREDYLSRMRTSGLLEVRVLSESGYTMEFLEADPTLRPLLALVRWVPPLRKYVDSVLSIKVNTVKG